MKLDPNDREPIVEQCEGCRRIETTTIKDVEKEVCKLYLYPDKKWLYGNCGGVDNKEIIADKETKKKRVGQGKTRSGGNL